MTQEEKQLLLQDLSARLSYNVVMTNKTLHETTYILRGADLDEAKFDNDWDDVPYLRPMSSMTEEEEDELCELCTLSDCNISADWECCGVEIIQSHPRYGTYFSTDYSVIDWLNKKMFDYRGLIPKDLAISTEVFNPYKD